MTNRYFTKEEAFKLIGEEKRVKASFFPFSVGEVVLIDSVRLIEEGFMVGAASLDGGNLEELSRDRFHRLLS